jgi:hypothetical protein
MSVAPAENARESLLQMTLRKQAETMKSFIASTMQNPADGKNNNSLEMTVARLHSKHAGKSASNAHWRADFA